MADSRIKADPAADHKASAASVLPHARFHHSIIQNTISGWMQDFFHCLFQAVIQITDHSHTSGKIISGPRRQISQCDIAFPVYSIQYFIDRSIPAYDETTRTGLVRHIYLRQAPATGQTMLCLVVNGGGLPRERELAARLAEKFPQLASIQLNRNDQNTNVILGPRSRVLWGATTITDRLCGLEVSLSPGAFYQVNSPAAQRLYAIAAEYAGLTGREALLDLYCGAGTIGLSMAGRCRQVIGVEIVPQAVENARENARRNGIGNARFLCADAAQAALQLEGEGITPDVVVLDPPRKGCDRALLETVARMAPRRVVYISCNSATLARDLAHLGTLGYRTCRCRPVDLFPRTAHVEAVALAQRE